MQVGTSKIPWFHRHDYSHATSSCPNLLGEHECAKLVQEQGTGATQNAPLGPHFSLGFSSKSADTSLGFTTPVFALEEPLTSRVPAVVLISVFYWLEKQHKRRQQPNAKINSKTLWKRQTFPVPSNGRAQEDV